jgi:hypothetical protein
VSDILAEAGCVAKTVVRSVAPGGRLIVPSRRAQVL